MKQKLAQQIHIPGLSGTPIEGPLPTTTPGVYRFQNLGDIITIALQYLFPLAGFLLFIYIVYGGFQWLIASGDPKKIESARNRITYAVVGFVLLIASYWITKIVQMILSPSQPFF